VQATTAPTHPPAADLAGLAQGLCAFIGYVQKNSGDDFFRLIGELELSLSQLKLLMILDRAGERTLGELAEALVLSLPAASRAVDGLVKRKMVVRREDVDDRRHKRVAISAKGSSVIGRLNQARLVAIQQALENLTTDERAKLAGALAPLFARQEIAALRPHGDAK
jgi:DNA-binding MarR family transcriptional regulator